MKPTALISKQGQETLGGSWLDNMSLAPSNDMIGMVAAGVRKAGTVKSDEKYLSYNEMMEVIGMSIMTSPDMIDTQTDIPLITRVCNAAHALEGRDYADEEVYALLGFVETSLRSNYVVEEGVPVVVGAGMGSRWTCIDPEQFLEWVDTVGGSKSLCCGLARGGSLIYAAVAAPDDIPAFKAIKSVFMTFVESFDGKTTCQAIPTIMLHNNTPVRIRPTRGNKDTSWVYRHTKNATEKINERVSMWQEARSCFYQAIELMIQMSQTKFDFAKLVDGMFPSDQPDGEYSTRRQNSRDELWSAYRNFAGEEYKGTIFGAWQALITWDTWTRPSRGEKNLLDRQVETFCGGQQIQLDNGRKILEKAFGREMMI